MTATAPAGAVFYAIGDVHGHADLLDALLEAIFEDAIEGDGAVEIIGLGDYVDRGPNSHLVLERLSRLRPTQDLSPILLRGNHEQALLDFLDDPLSGEEWCSFGGRETLAGYGVEMPRGTSREGWERTRDAFAAALPDHHLSLLRGLRLSYTAGDYFFVHAGARPGVPLDDQEENDLLWIRRPFLDAPEPFDKVVVHGHTPSREVHADARRIGIDTWVYTTGVLTALRLEGASRAIIQAIRTGAGAIRTIRSPL